MSFGALRPVLYSFRRCPYAMRARLALAASRQSVELREVVLRAKPAELLAASPKGTVPVLVLTDGQVIDESLEIMRWALSHNDPEAWHPEQEAILATMLAWIARCDTDFKHQLDRYKYPERFGTDPDAYRAAGAQFLADLDTRLRASPFLFDAHATLADMAIFPFVRQFAQTDRDWFDAQNWPALVTWLDRLQGDPRFIAVMEKYPPWETGTPGVDFPPDASTQSPSTQNPT